MITNSTGLKVSICKLVCDKNLPKIYNKYVGGGGLLNWSSLSVTEEIQFHGLWQIEVANFSQFSSINLIRLLEEFLLQQNLRKDEDVNTENAAKLDCFPSRHE